MSTQTAPAVQLTSRLRLNDAVTGTLAAAVVAFGTVHIAAHTTWIWTALAALVVAGLCYLHIARLHAYLRGHAATCGHDVRYPLMVMWWWHLAALAFTLVAVLAANLWALANGPVEAVLAAIAAIIMARSVRACWHALKLTHHVLIELQQR